MNINNMSKRALFLSMLMLLMLALTASSVSAADSEISDVVRTVPDSVTTNTEFSVMLEIEGDSPLVVGIVEYIPSGLSFPDDDADICSSCDFTVDRDNMTIAFSAIDVDTISYTLVSSSTGIYDFSGEWVDLLYQDVEVDDVAERLEDTSGDNVLEVVAKSSRSSSSSKSSMLSVSSTAAETTENVSVDMGEAPEGEAESLKSTPADGDEEVEYEAGTGTPASAADDDVESSASSVPGFELPLSGLAFMLVLAVAGRRGKR
ncbi:hypothetical protein [uncultured Methanolobus sp.]|uniref:hypothetical protein n=1 Tax=uncultured Methanolobus sp. TaxID=218300 RepID=UPI002AABC4F2|nr:hypothetical protein [uncultured Methanolobus sp.]